MTAAARSFGRQVEYFWVLPSTDEYLEGLSEIVGKSDLFVSLVGCNGGPWGHPKLAVFFARWLDTKFAVWCDMVIDDILNKKMEVKVVKPEQSMAMRVPKSFPEALRLAAEMAERNEKLESKLAVAEKELNLVTVDEYRALTKRKMYRVIKCGK